MIVRLLNGPSPFKSRWFKKSATMRRFRPLIFPVMVLLIYGQPSLVLASSTLSDDADVRMVITSEMAGWTKYDATQIASCHTEDVTWQNPFGVRIMGRHALEAFLTKLFRQPGYRSAQDTDPPKITEIHFLSPGTAVVWSEESSMGQIDEVTKKPLAPRHSHYLEVLVKVNNAWLISDSMIMDEYPTP